MGAGRRQGLCRGILNTCVRAEDMLKIAAARGMTIMLDVAETAGWLDIFEANGPDKAAEFGHYVGDRQRSV